MILNQYYLGCLSQASYLIADPSPGERSSSIPGGTSLSTSADAAAKGLTIELVVLPTCTPTSSPGTPSWRSGPAPRSR